MLSVEGGAVWWNYPGFELWKFVNLLIFVAAAIYLHRRFGRPLSQALALRRESIKSELQRAEEERATAVAKLADIEARFDRLDSETSSIRDRSKAEAEAERHRIEQSTSAGNGKVETAGPTRDRGRVQSCNAGIAEICRPRKRLSRSNGFAVRFDRMMRNG